MANPNSADSEDMYGDAEIPASKKSAPRDSSESEDAEGETALLPKNICPGMKPGDELRLRVVRVHEDQYEVEYEGKGGEKAEPPEDNEMASMME